MYIQLCVTEILHSAITNLKQGPLKCENKDCINQSHFDVAEQKI